MRTRTKATGWPLALFLLAALVPGARAACTYATSPASRLHGFGAATNTVTVNAGPACPWTVSNTNTWITILAGASGVSTGSVTYAVAPNPSPVERTGLVVIAGNTFTLRQSALSCSFSISPSTRTHGSGLVSNSIILTANGSGCPWSVSSGVPWITLVSPGTGLGSATVDYQVAPNPGLEWRTGMVMVAGQTFTLIQRGVTCSYGLTPASRNHGYGSASNSFNVATLSGCAWTAVSGAPWISIVSGASGSASGDVGYVLSPNPTGASRTGLVSVAGQVFSLVQAGQPCTYAVLAANTTHGAGSETGSVMVSATAGCVWVVENPVNWVSILSGASGTGDGMVVYAVSANPGPGPRSAQLTIAGQPFAIYQDEPFCTYKLSPTNRVHGPAATTNSLAIVAAPGCAWTLVSTSSWVRCLASTGSGSTNIDYVVDANPGFTDRVTTLSAGGQMLTLRQLGISCVPVLSPTTRSHGYGGASNGFSLTVNGGCNWSAAASVPWISIVSGTNGSGNGSVGYMVEPNPSGLARTGAVLVADAVFNILQSAAPCGYAITPSMRNHGYGAASNAIVVTATPDCAWSVANTNAWLTVVAGATGAGDGIVGYLVAANTSTVPRSGHLVVAGQVFAVSQAGAACTSAIEPAERAHGFNLETGLVRVTSVSGCAWTVVNTNSWVAIMAGAQGGTESGVVEYVLATNPGNTPRFGYLTIAGQPYAVSQGATSCSYRLSPASRTHGYAAASNFATLTVSNGCTWSVANTSVWITVVSPLSGNGSSILSYTLAANSAPVPRVGGITVGGQTLVITQQAAACTITLSPVSRMHGSGAASNSIAVSDTLGCGWAVVNTNAWLSFPVASGTGSVSVGYTIAANPLPSDRAGVVVIGGAAFAIQQQAAACTVTVSPVSRMHGSGAASNSIVVSDTLGCGWAVVNTNAWLNFLVTSGTGSVSVSYTIAANPLPTDRSGVVLMGGAAFSIQQQGIGCAWSLSPGGRMHGNGAATNLIGITTAAGCAWSVVKTSAWVTVLSGANGDGNGTVTYAVDPNPSPEGRSTVLVIGDQAFNLTQAGSACSYRLSPGSRTHGFLAVTNFFTVNVGPNCPWSVVNTNPWVTLLSASSGVGSNVVSYTVAPNLTTNLRSGTLSIGESLLSLTQRAATNGFVFEVYTIQDGSQMRLRLTGVPTGVWELQRSTDLRNWSRLGDVTNNAGVVDYLDPAPTNLERRFYRAVLR